MLGTPCDQVAAGAVPVDRQHHHDWSKSWSDSLPARVLRGNSRQSEGIPGARIHVLPRYEQRALAGSAEIWRITANRLDERQTEMSLLFREDTRNQVSIFLCPRHRSGMGVIWDVAPGRALSNSRNTN